MWIPIICSGIFFLKEKPKGIANYRRMVREIDFPNKKWAAVQRNKEYFWALSEGCHWLLGALEDHFPTPQATEVQVNA